MAFRFDMQGKNTQQQAIVAKRDKEEIIKQQEAIKMREREAHNQENPQSTLLVINKDTCPRDDNIIMKGQCANCPSYKKFQIDAFQQPCIQCSYMFDINKT